MKCQGRSHTKSTVPLNGKKSFTDQFPVGLEKGLFELVVEFFIINVCYCKTTMLENIKDSYYVSNYRTLLKADKQIAKAFEPIVLKRFRVSGLVFRPMRLSENVSGSLT